MTTLTELKEKAHELKEPNQQMPYWFINSVMTPEPSEWLGTKTDHNRQRVGNFFYSKEQAETYADKIIKFLKQHNKVN